MKKFKKLAVGVLLCITILSNSVIAFASDIMTSSINDIVSSYNYELADLDEINGNYDVDNFVKIDSAQELDQFLFAIKNAFNEVTEVEVKESDMMTRLYGISSKSEWAPFYMYGLGAWLTVWKNCTMSYTYEKELGTSTANYFTGITNVTSDITGVFIGQGWVQTGYAANIVNGGYGVDIEIHGYGYVGADIQGYPTAIRIDDIQNWHFTYLDI